MKKELLDNLSNPEMLEKMFRENRKGFKEAFNEIYRGIENTEVSKFWKARLDFDLATDAPKSFAMSELVKVITICIITAFLIKIPALFHLKFSDEVFYMKNAAIIVFTGLTLYYILGKRISNSLKLVMTGLAFLVPAVFVNLLPSENASDAVKLTYIHLPLLMWFIFGFIYCDYNFRDLARRIDFIRFNGDLAIIYALVAIAGGLLTAITIGLFNSIGLNIDKFYGDYIVITGATAAPVVATFLTDKFPALVNRTAPLIATIFSPMVLVTLIIFLITMIVTGKDPYNDRNFLLIFNLMLLGVMGIIIFSVSETSVIKNQKFNAGVLFALSVVTIIIDLIALSAIFYRLGEYGLSPNRLAVLVSNILVLINLFFIMADLFKINFKKKDFITLELTVAKYMPVYLIWIIIVVFGFPLLFGINMVH